MTQTEEQRLATFTDAGVIDTATLEPTEQVDFDAPAYTPTTNIASLLPPTPQTDKQEDLLGDIEGFEAQLLGKTGFETEQQYQFGLPGLTQQQEELTSQLQGFQLQSLALEQQKALTGARVTEESIGRRGMAGIGQLTSSEQRQLTLRQFDVAQQALTSAITLNAVQGRIGTANRLIDQAVSEKYGRVEAELAASERNLDRLIDSGVLTREENRRAEAQKAINDAKQAEIDDAKAEDTAIFNIATSIAPNISELPNASEIIDSINNAETKEEALAIATQYAQSPEAKLALKTAMLDYTLKQLDIVRKQKEIRLLGEPTPDDIKDINASMKEAEASLGVAQDKLDAIDILETHKGMATTVGPTRVGRKGSFVGIPGTSVQLGRSMQSMIAGAKGYEQDFAGGVHKLVSGLTLDSLIAAKARGATFGALSDTELEILANAATAINDWEIKDKNGIGIGQWDIDEASFKRELAEIKRLTTKAIAEYSGTIVPPNDASTIDEIYDALEVEDYSQY